MTTLPPAAAEAMLTLAGVVPVTAFDASGGQPPMPGAADLAGLVDGHADAVVERVGALPRHHAGLAGRGDADDVERAGRGRSR